MGLDSRTKTEQTSRMDDPSSPPHQVDRAVITAMRDLIQGAINVVRQSVGEASGRAWGFCYARYPALPATIIDQAVEHVLMELQLLPPLPATVEIESEEFREVDDVRLAQAIGYMIAFDERGKPHRVWADGANSMAARHLVGHLRARGYVVLARVKETRLHTARDKL